MSPKTDPVKPWIDRLLEIAVALVATGLLLNWAWTLLKPLVPVFIVLAGLGVIGSAVVRWRRGW